MRNTKAIAEYEERVEYIKNQIAEETVQDFMEKYNLSEEEAKKTLSEMYYVNFCIDK